VTVSVLEPGGTTATRAFMRAGDGFAAAADTAAGPSPSATGSAGVLGDRGASAAAQLAMLVVLFAAIAAARRSTRPR
jgi:hypothetical protein